MLTLLLGGARSGKSTLAERLARASRRPVSVIVTARPIDDDMQARIARHRADRPDHWTTVEAPLALGDALTAIPNDCCVVVDCLTMWTSNLLLEGQGEAEIEDESRRVACLAAARSGPTIVVTNEVGMGVHPSTPLGIRYRDLHGRANAAWSDLSERALLVVAGRVIPLERPEGVAG
jgi:adenosyl cobinamide kinase/adenosyl cobinamide phosphate guanylyltransferase